MKFVIIALLFLTWLGRAPGASGQNAPYISHFEARPQDGGLVVREDLGAHFRAAGVHGTFVLYDLDRAGYLVYNPERVDSAYIPASTFKILNALVALETRVIDGADEMFEWDGVERPYDMWNQDHNLRSAFRVSAVWFYQELARRIGEGRLWHYVQAAEYGNVNIEGDIDRFWLDGELRISAMEQVQFLRRLYADDVPFSQPSIDTVKAIMIVEEHAEYLIRAKTGWGGEEGDQIGWWVGYVERGDNVYFFATNIDMNEDKDAAARISVTRAILEELGII
jgi:beta-lactamase class D